MSTCIKPNTAVAYKALEEFLQLRERMTEIEPFLEKCDCKEFNTCDLHKEYEGYRTEYSRLVWFNGGSWAVLLSAAIDHLAIIREYSLRQVTGPLGFKYFRECRDISEMADAALEGAPVGAFFALPRRPDLFWHRIVPKE